LPTVAISAGTRLGPYEIVSSIGAGGMGEVYRARDPRIGREVALKILPRAFAENEDRLRRFTQEAKTAGALNHPNLLTIFDIGTENGTPYIVSELLEGQTLRERGAIPHRKALDYAAQIAAGLSAAHDRGIVHRDLKPENIFVTVDERIKLLDFGLAKMLSDATGENESKTMERFTDPGVVMGTASYMSPEQVRGQALDQRSDIFSFGTVLYELLTGANPFQRQSQIETMNAILNDEPSLPGAVAPALQRVVLHALEKDPAQRFQSMKDVRFALDTFSGSGESAPVAAGRARREKKVLEKKPIEFTAVTYRRGYIMTARFARDGSVVYGAAWEDKPLELFASFPGDPQARSLGVTDVDVLSVSPTGGELAISLGRHFLAGWVSSGTLARLPLTGGAPRELAEDVQDADWNLNGTDLAAIRRSGDVFVVEYPIGHTIHTSSHWISNVRISPRGDMLAFINHPIWGDDGGSVVVIDLNGQKRLQSASWRSTAGLAWTPKGDEVWLGVHPEGGGGRSVMAVSLSGKARPILPMPSRVTLHDINRNGDVLLSSELGRREILVGRRGVAGERNLSWCDWSFLTDISADGSRVVFVEQAAAARGSLGGIYVRNVDGSPAIHLGEGHARTFSPDGKWVAVMTGVPDHLELLPVGAGRSRTVPVKGLEMMVWWNWFPDGKRLLVWGNEPNHGIRMFEIAIDGDGTPRPVGPEGVKWPVAISPDGKEAAVTGPDERLTIYSLTGDSSREVPGSRPGDQALLWSDDNGLYVYQFGRLRAVIERIDLSTGERSEWQELKPADAAGVMNIQPVVLAANRESYAYSFRRFMSELHVVSGLL
jgi:hypothetical protein